MRTDKILSRPVLVPGNGARVLPFESMPRHGTQILLGHGQKVLFRLVPMPENRERAPCLNGT